MKKSEGRDKCFALGTWVLARWDSVRSYPKLEAILKPNQLYHHDYNCD